MSCRLLPIGIIALYCAFMYLAPFVRADNLEQACFRKGGVGTVGDDIYILLDENRNELKIAGKDWSGKLHSECEVVLTDGKKILTEKDNLASNSLRIIVFTPDKVRFIDYKRGATGTYKRLFQGQTKAFTLPVK